MGGWSTYQQRFSILSLYHKQTWHALICVEYSNWICLLKIGKETGLHPCRPQTV